MASRILAFDIEASNLAADFGIVLCVGFKEVGKGEAEVLNILDYSKGDLIEAERKLLKNVTKRLLDSEIWLTHFGTWYDIPFLNTRLLYHRLPIIPPSHPHVDTWKISKNRLKLRNNRLITISEFLGTKEEKNSIKPEQWIRALGGHRASMDYIVEHCRRDVEVLEEAYMLLRPLTPNHPHMGVDGKVCPICGKAELRKEGYRLTRTRRYRRYQCKACGAWSKSDKFEKISFVNTEAA
jgi:uncharacterized protein YprB with RNaseH-like and TPR domain